MRELLQINLCDNLKIIHQLEVWLKYSIQVGSNPHLTSLEASLVGLSSAHDSHF